MRYTRHTHISIRQSTQIVCTFETLFIRKCTSKLLYFYYFTLLIVKYGRRRFCGFFKCLGSLTIHSNISRWVSKHLKLYLCTYLLLKCISLHPNIQGATAVCHWISGDTLKPILTFFFKLFMYKQFKKKYTY